MGSGVGACDPEHGIGMTNDVFGCGMDRNISAVFKCIMEQRRAPGVITQHIHIAGVGFSWGGFESLVLPQEVSPVRSATKWDAPGPLIRLHIGLEDTRDLKEDLESALKRFQKTI